MNTRDRNDIHYAGPQDDTPVGNDFDASVEDILRSLSADEFAALGDDEVVYRRVMNGTDLKALFPQAAEAPDGQDFFVLFGADGTPRFVTNDQGQVYDWLEQSGLEVATVQ
jgi:hypothetical protein